MKKNNRVLVAMSGGVDSSVAAVMLHEQGYEVVGITMKTWDYADRGVKYRKMGCCSLDAINDARHVAVTLGFHHVVVDVRQEFQRCVVEKFQSEYLSGRTPNPCILCNTHIKWHELLKKADAFGCDYIATGHYARIRKDGDRYVISKGIDPTKDQSYVLWGISQEDLSRTLFPLGNFTKSHIYDLAKRYGFLNLVNKPESYEICFIPDNDYRGFLRRRVPRLKDRIQAGNFVLKDGTVVGQHEGYPFYTIGQRKGLNLALGYPVYVVAIKPASNTIVVGPLEDLKCQSMEVHRLNLSKYDHLLGKKLEVLTRIRYHDRGSRAVIEQVGNKMHVLFREAVYAVTPGQAAVFYEQDDVLGGGWIRSSS